MTGLCTVLVIGGYGFFGRRLVERLAGQTGLHILVAGRSPGAAEALVRQTRLTARSELSAVALDAMATTLRVQLAHLRPDVVVHTSGPFQSQDYRVAEACIAAGVHYIDLADGREFVSGIGALDAAARRAGVLVTSGASSVPALSAAVADALCSGLARVDGIDIGISPGNRTERGQATVKAILSYCGQPLPAGSGAPRFGWSGASRHRYPAPVGSRLLSPCDVPDLTLLPPRYPGTPTLHFGAGLELALLHRGMNLMAWLARVGLVHDWSAHAGWLTRAADLFRRWGTDAGAMHVDVSGSTPQGQPARRHWHLLATHGDGPYVPTLAASALVRKLAAHSLPATGALPCVGLLTLQDFEREAQGLHITMAESGA